MFRDYGFTLQEKKALARKKCFEIDGGMALLAGLLILIAALIIHHKIEPTMGQIQGLITPEAHAAELHDLDAICAYAGLYPEKITNLKDAQKECAVIGIQI